MLFRDIDLIKYAKLNIRYDNGKKLMVLLRAHMDKERSDGEPLGSSFCIKELLKLICLHRAVECANALLQGDAGIFVDNVNLPLEEGGLPPLHLAAQQLSPGLTKAFLMAGADPNLCCDGDDAKLPLCLALEALSCNRCVAEWNVEKSVAKLIYIFCLKELKEPLATIRILASRTEHLEKLSLQYAEKGEVVKLTALLLVAWSKLVAPYDESHHENVECCPIAQCIQRELQLLSSLQEMTAQCSSKLVKLESAWKMLELLEQQCHRIDLYRLFNSRMYDDDGNLREEVENHEVPYNVAVKLRIGGPEDVRCDDIECLMPRLKPKQKAWLDRALQTHCGQRAVYTVGNKKTFAAAFFQSLNPNVTNNLRGQRALTTEVEKPSFRRFIPTARMCSYLVSMAKRSFK